MDLCQFEIKYLSEKEAPNVTQDYNGNECIIFVFVTIIISYDVRVGCMTNLESFCIFIGNMLRTMS